jgi:endonuclease/exonuclease/phosphatase family metal-dependent hydrolase
MLGAVFLSLSGDIMKLRLLTYNIHKGFTVGNRKFVLDQIKASIHQTHATLVCLQEVVGEHKGHAKREKNWPGMSQLEFLADQTWSHFAYGKNAVYTEGHHGNALLSKYPITFWENEDASLSKLERRGFLHAVLDVPGIGNVHVISLHLNLFEKDRLTQLRQLCARVKRMIPQDEPLLIAGDFNDWRQKAGTLLQKELGLKEAFMELSGEHARTFPAAMPLMCLDRIYYRGLVCRSAKVTDSKLFRNLSDHLPLVAEFTKP